MTGKHKVYRDVGKGIGENTDPEKGKEAEKTKKLVCPRIPGHINVTDVNFFLQQKVKDKEIQDENRSVHANIFLVAAILLAFVPQGLVLENPITAEPVTVKN